MGNGAQSQAQCPSVWRRVATAAVAVAISAITVEASGLPRSSSVRTEFRKANPCPATGKTTGRCPGWEIDHRVALVCGGPDAVQNLQWLEIERHREKTRLEIKACRGKKLASPHAASDVPALAPSP